MTCGDAGGATLDGRPCGQPTAPGKRCGWHPDAPEYQAARQRSELARKGAIAVRTLRVMPEGTPKPRWRSRTQIVTFLEDQAHLVRTGALDRQIAAEARLHAETALKAYELEAFEKLERFERVISGKARRLS
jgi:hypothetical protein